MAYGIETRCIHGEDGITREHAYGSMGTPIYQTATFAHPGVGQSTGFDYTRESNPTRSELERIVSSLEKAYDTVACASGMAALSILLELFENGAHFVCSEDLYGGSVRIFSTIGANRGLTFSYVNTADAELVRKPLKKRQKPSILRLQATRPCR